MPETPTEARDPVRNRPGSRNHPLFASGYCREGKERTREFSGKRIKGYCK
jgi:hypothetical protein